MQEKRFQKNSKMAKTCLPPLKRRNLEKQKNLDLDLTKKAFRIRFVNAEAAQNF
jgi:hypothetical protein